MLRGTSGISGPQPFSAVHCQFFPPLPSPREPLEVQSIKARVLVLDSESLKNPVGNLIAPRAKKGKGSSVQPQGPFPGVKGELMVERWLFHAPLAVWRAWLAAKVPGLSVC